MLLLRYHVLAYTSGTSSRASWGIFFMLHSIEGVLLKNSDGTLFVPTLLSALTVNLLLDVKSMVFYHLLRFAHVNGRQPLFH